MPSGIHQVIIQLPIYDVWSFVKEIDHWAPLVPGYINHEIVNANQSSWEFYGDIGIIKKKINLMVTIKDWHEPTKVTFDLKGLNENFAGSGYFKAEALGQNKTKMIGYLSIVAEGIKGKMINNVLKTSVPKMTEELTENIAAQLYS